MTDLFLKILNMSAAASVVIVAVLVMRLLLRKAPKKWSYLLWSVAAFRLCCPVSLQAAFSIFRFRAIQPTFTQTTGQTTALAYLPQAANAAAMPQPVGTAQAALPAPTEAADLTRFLLTAAVIIWCVGMAVLLLYGIASYTKTKSLVTDAVILRDNIYESDRIRSPFILGFLRPRIYIPLGLDCERMRYVLEHERSHIRRRDCQIKAFAFLLLTVHWFNPLCWVAFYLMGKDMEMSCDERVLGSIEGSRKAYSTTLLSFAAPSHFPAASPLAFGETSVRSRIKNSLSWKKPKMWVTLAAAVLCIVCLAACALNPTDDNTSAASEPSEPAAEQTQPEETQLAIDAVDGMAVLDQVLKDITDPDIPLSMNYDYNARYVENSQYYAKGLANNTYTPIDGMERPGGLTIELGLSRDLWLFIYEGGLVELRDGENTYQFLADSSEPGVEDAYELARSWFDEVEYGVMYFEKIDQGALLVEDTGQTFVEAAFEGCEALEHIYLETTPGSRYRYSYVSCVVEAEEEWTEFFRQAEGEDRIDENTWCFSLTTYFEPENERALARSAAGDTDLYTGDDIPYVDGPVYESTSFGYITKADDGWHIVLTGTGW